MNNMMVEHHIQNDKIELDVFYECVHDLGDNDNHEDTNESVIEDDGHD